MSAFENYTRTSRSYDATRAAIGVEVILGCIASAVPPADATVLDAGCGTGNYAAALLPFVRGVVGVDLNAGMLDAARGKLAGAVAAGRARLEQADLAGLPLADASVDAAMINQVLHHLPDDPGSGWPARQRVLAELARVVRPGGVLTINACMPVQLREAWWFFSLIPEAVERVARRHTDYDELAALLAAAGFECRGRIVPVDAIVQGPHYFDTHGPERAQWRDGDSTWAEVTAAELERALSTLAGLHETGRIDAYVREHDRRRLEVGQISFVHAVRRAR